MFIIQLALFTPTINASSTNPDMVKWCIQVCGTQNVDCLIKCLNPRP